SFLLIPPPPTPTLFPYTTLFRSHYHHVTPDHLDDDHCDSANDDHDLVDDDVEHEVFDHDHQHLGHDDDGAADRAVPGGLGILEEPSRAVDGQLAHARQPSLCAGRAAHAAHLAGRGGRERAPGSPTHRSQAQY